jgi:hypothetical protein
MVCTSSREAAGCRFYLGLGGGTSSYGLTAGAGAGAGALDGVLYDAAGPQHDTAGEQ